MGPEAGSGLGARGSGPYPEQVGILEPVRALRDMDLGANRMQPALSERRESKGRRRRAAGSVLAARGWCDVVRPLKYGR